MIWIVQMIVVLVVAHYVVRFIDRAWNKRKQTAAHVGQIIASPMQRRNKVAKESQWWTPQDEHNALKFPRDSSSRSSAG